MNKCSECTHRVDCAWNGGCGAFELDLAEHDKQIRDEVIEDVLTVLKIMHMDRTYEDDYVARIEAPFYIKLFSKIKQMEGEQNE